MHTRAWPFHSILSGWSLSRLHLRKILAGCMTQKAHRDSRRAGQRRGRGYRHLHRPRQQRRLRLRYRRLRGRLLRGCCPGGRSPSASAGGGHEAHLQGARFPYPLANLALVKTSKLKRSAVASRHVLQPEGATF